MILNDLAKGVWSAFCKTFWSKQRAIKHLEEGRISLAELFINQKTKDENKKQE